jgi:sporulation protein YlmC with PRC-barrel domain
VSVRVDDLYHTDVVTSKGRRLGRVSDVLFHAEKPLVVGYVVERPRILYMLDRKDRFLSADKVSASRAEVVVTDAAGAWDDAAARRLGIDWATTVIWSGMPVRTRSGVETGTVKDVEFARDGRVEALVISSGATADLAVGTRRLEGESIDGYYSGAVVVADEADELETSGGAAAAAGRGAAVAGEQARQAAVVAGQAVKAAATYGKAAAKVAAKSKTGKKTMRWLRKARDTMIDAMGDSDDD